MGPAAILFVHIGSTGTKRIQTSLSRKIRNGATSRHNRNAHRPRKDPAWLLFHSARSPGHISRPIPVHAQARCAAPPITCCRLLRSRSGFPAWPALDRDCPADDEAGQGEVDSVRRRDRHQPHERQQRRPARHRPTTRRPSPERRKRAHNLGLSAALSASARWPCRTAPTRSRFPRASSGQPDASALGAATASAPEQHRRYRRGRSERTRLGEADRSLTHRVRGTPAAGRPSRSPYQRNRNNAPLGSIFLPRREISVREGVLKKKYLDTHTNIMLSSSP